LANVQERKRPGAIIGNDPAISVEIKFPLDRAGRAMKSSQVLGGLFKDSGRQIFLARLGCIIFGNVHLGLLVHSFLKLSNTDISENLRSLSQSPAPLLRLTTKNRQGQNADQNTEQRTRDGEPEGNAPA
jgi:hypothetical protein